jgi:hypothetical protein
LVTEYSPFESIYVDILNLKGLRETLAVLCAGIDTLSYLDIIPSPPPSVEQ